MFTAKDTDCYMRSDRSQRALQHIADALLAISWKYVGQNLPPVMVVVPGNEYVHYLDMLRGPGNNTLRARDYFGAQRIALATPNGLAPWDARKYTIVLCGLSTADIDDACGRKLQRMPFFTHDCTGLHRYRNTPPPVLPEPLRGERTADEEVNYNE